MQLIKYLLIFYLFSIMLKNTKYIFSYFLQQTFLYYKSYAFALQNNCFW
ncbi:hypothetical protein HMPREF9144_0272 [Prevotella pallens ATCC 700821]|uniref:Uncharacterized protein n=1 Tax=Prevotella pallens ATCC 700821 TaxID=997353 RepID=F9DF32_9BACT|nr:hypothetical protein HMPREF9144_0272 [Prevotella pallens ATCC 700821]